MSENRILKEQIVKEIDDKFSKSLTTFFIEYLGSSVSELSQLRNDLRNSDSEIKVYKNRLLKIFAKNNGFEDLNKSLLGSTATIFSFGDNVEALRIVGKHIKDNEFLKFKLGIFDNKIVDDEFLSKISKIPSMEVLLTQIGTGLLQFLQQLAFGLTLLDESHLKMSKSQEETKEVVKEEKAEVESKKTSNEEAKEVIKEEKVDVKNISDVEIKKEESKENVEDKKDLEKEKKGDKENG